MPIVSWRIFWALIKVGYWGRIRDSKFKRLPKVYDHCAETAERTLLSLQTNMLALSPFKKNCLNFTFSHFVHYGSKQTLEIWKVAIVFGHWTVTTGLNVWYFTYLKKSNHGPATFLIQEIPKHFTYCGFYSLPIKIYKLLFRSVFKIQIFSFRKMHLKVSPGKCRPFCLGLNVAHSVSHDICTRFCFALLYFVRLQGYKKF